MRKAPGPACVRTRSRPVKGGFGWRTEDRGRCRKDARECLRHVTTFLVGPPLPVSVFRASVHAVQVSRASARSATTGPGGQLGADRQGWLSRPHPPPMQTPARTRPPCERAGRGARPVNRPAVSGPMRGDGPCRGPVGFHDLPGRFAARLRTAVGLQDNDGGTGAATRPAATPARRERRRLTRITPTGRGSSRDGRVDHEGPQ